VILAGMGFYWARKHTRKKIHTQIQRLSSEDEAVYKKTVVQLAKYGKTAIPQLKEALKDENPRIRRGAIEVLASIGDKSVLSVVLESLAKDDDANVRAMAAEALAIFGGKQAVQALLKSIEDPASIVRAAAVRSLGKLGAHEAVEPLIKILGGREQMAFVRAAAAEALGNIGGDDAMKALKQAMTFDPDSSVAEAAEAAYRRLQAEQSE